MRNPHDAPDDRAAALRYWRIWVAAGFVLVAFVVYLSVMHDPPQIPGDRENWLGHGMAYGSMMAWFARLAPAAPARRRFALAFCAMGVALEFVQATTGYRTYDEHDMVANACGVMLGWLASPPRVPDGIGAVDAWLARMLGRLRG